MGYACTFRILVVVKKINLKKKFFPAYYSTLEVPRFNIKISAEGLFHEVRRRRRSQLSLEVRFLLLHAILSTLTD